MSGKAEEPGAPAAGLASAARDGLSAAWPIGLGYFPIGLSFGVLAQKAGLGPWQVALMSVLVFAGSSQFIAVAMISTGASAASIVVTTFLINLRHFLMSSSLAVHLPGVNRRFLALLAYGITDESFAVSISRFRGGDWDRWRALALNHVANMAWVVSTVAGTFAGEFIPAGAFGIDYALPGMFLCLLAFQLRGGVYVATVLVSALVSIVFYLALPGNAYIILASVFAATAGFVLSRAQQARGDRA